MLGKEDFDRQEIIRAHLEATIRRMAKCGGPILAVQDTTGVNYNTHIRIYPGIRPGWIGIRFRHRITAQANSTSA
jgi:hypothetical protein